MVGVDGHAADRVHGEVSLRVLTGTDCSEQLDRLAHVAQLLAAARLVQDAVEVMGQRGGVPGQQELAADGLA